MAADFNATSSILTNPGAADVSAVGKNIDAWKESLAPLGSAGQSIVSDLDALKTELTSSSPDGSKIGKLMTKLGDATTQNAGGNSDLMSLGQQLSALGA